MNEVILTYVINNITILTVITIIGTALIYQAVSEVKKVLIIKTK